MPKTITHVIDRIFSCQTTFEKATFLKFGQPNNPGQKARVTNHEQFAITLIVISFLKRNVTNQRIWLQFIYAIALVINCSNVPFHHQQVVLIIYCDHNCFKI